MGLLGHKRSALSPLFQNLVILSLGQAKRLAREFDKIVHVLLPKFFLLWYHIRYILVVLEGCTRVTIAIQVIYLGQATKTSGWALRLRLSLFMLIRTPFLCRERIHERIFAFIPLIRAIFLSLVAIVKRMIVVFHQRTFDISLTLQKRLHLVHEGLELVHSGILCLLLSTTLQ